MRMSSNERGRKMPRLQNNFMLGATFVFLATLFTSTASSGPSRYHGSPSYGGYNQHNQQENYHQQQGQWNTDSSQVSYEKDSSNSQEQAVANASTGASTEPTSSEEETESPLPEGWSEHFDPNSGQYYYYNASDGTTSWDRPTLPDVTEQGIVEVGNAEVDSVPSEISSKYTASSNIAEPGPGSGGINNGNGNQTPEQGHDGLHQDLVAGESNTESDTGGMVDSSSEVENWRLNYSQTNQPGHDGASQPEDQQRSWEGQRSSSTSSSTDHSRVAEWGSPPQSSQQQSGDVNKLIQSNSTVSSVDGGDHGEQLNQREEMQHQYPGQPNHRQQEQPGCWGLPQKEEHRPPQPKPWGVPRSTERWDQQNPNLHKQQSPPLSSQEVEKPADNFPSDQASSNDRRGETSVTSIPGDRRPQTNDSPYPQKEQWQQQTPIQGFQRRLESPQRQPGQQGPPDSSRPALQQQTPKYSQRPYPPQYYSNIPPGPGQYNANVPSVHGQYNANVPPGYGQYDRPYYPIHQHQPQRSNTGTVISQRTEGGSATVKEALSSTWKGLLGFGNRTREVVGSAREQVVTGATSAGQTLSAKSSSFWETAKSTVGNVFESSDSNPKQDYSLSPQPPLDNRLSAVYPGVNPSGPENSGGRGLPSRNPGGLQEPGRYRPPYGQQAPPFGQQAPPYGRQTPPYGQRPPSHEHRPRIDGRPNSNGSPGGPPPPRREQGGQHPGSSRNDYSHRPPSQSQPQRQIRRDPSYPPMKEGQQLGPMQSRYGGQSGTKLPTEGGRYPYQQTQVPDSGQRGPLVSGSQFNMGPSQQKPNSPWDHPGLNGES